MKPGTSSRLRPARTSAGSGADGLIDMRLPKSPAGATRRTTSVLASGASSPAIVSTTPSRKSATPLISS